MRKLGCVLALALLGTSCRGMLEVHDHYRFEEHPGKGLVVVSTRISSECGNDASVDFESDKGDPGTFLFQNGLVAPDFTDPPGFFWVMQLPPGRYKLKRLRLGSKYSSRSPIDAVFTVKEGQTFYLGELQMQVVGCSRFDFRVVDRWDRDEGLFAKKMKNVTAASVAKQILPTPGRPPAPAATPAAAAAR
jgi:hypothetical protein